jgi:hypothetical protein
MFRFAAVQRLRHPKGSGRKILLARQPWGRTRGSTDYRAVPFDGGSTISADVVDSVTPISGRRLLTMANANLSVFEETL